MPATLRLNQGDTPVVIEVMADTADVALPAEPSERAFALARRLALATSGLTELVVTEDERIVAEVSDPVASVASLIAL